MPNTSGANLLEDLRWRGLIQQTTDEEALIRHLSDGGGGSFPQGGRLVYAGFDPTADSLTIGNLVPLMLLKRFQDAGHTPVAVMGGGTGMIGDPSGKDAERTLNTPEIIAANVEAQRPIIEQVLAFEGPNAARIINNADWLGPLGYIECLRDVGKHFSVNMMIQKESVRARLQEREHGISYTEFSYMILQAYDFYRLHADHGVTIQVGGSDQWGNIVAGIDLTRRLAQAEVHGYTCPLVTKSDGGKFGKTESGAVWLSANRTSPYAFRQFWLNASDEDAPRFLRFFTTIPRQEIEALEAEHAQNPGARKAHTALADHMTAMLHGREEAARAAAAAHALFSGDVAGLDERTLNELFEGAPSSDHARSQLEGDGAGLVDFLLETSLCKSKRESREFLGAGAISVNGEKADTERRLTQADLLHDSAILLRRGKKNWHVTRWK
ncbi:MAG: tyrosine--tRNA ligase [Phycisphaeraceae bacterium]|nr:tyrosine--tRNA ligase [Phycisphaeraceae bacterium]MCB9847473.1 tyrosine--tRNA ligase [Phycisphaeraceae bacterium]